ncbi:conserved hypothetical protein [Trichinella spiralis]|uniref:hypothetical protein n=1 Tax=Trichinella spiralis TaxID=6334 RepID=UPI0001EFBD3B|nr:conserved hypothetical protein [Trichinella spiralis]
MTVCLVDVASEKRINEETVNNNKKPNLALYKTRMCRYFVNGPGCRFGSSCFFAHNLVELRPSMYRNFLYKTEPCRNLRTWGHCKYGPRCLYLHGDEQFLIYARTPPSSFASIQPIWPGTSPVPFFGSSARSASLSTELSIPLDNGEPFDIQFDKKTMHAEEKKQKAEYCTLCCKTRTILLEFCTVKWPCLIVEKLKNK